VEIKHAPRMQSFRRMQSFHALQEPRTTSGAAS
jgi:hypothetical protein